MTDARPGLPALCADLKLHSAESVALVNSRDVAEAFAKEHKNVLRDISGLEIGSELSRSWFRAATVLDAYGREQPSFDMTRQGFTVLVMGWTGERAMAFKVRYIEAFDAMEAELRERDDGSTKFLAAVREIVAPLTVRFDYQDHAIQQVSHGLGAVTNEVRALSGDMRAVSGKVAFLEKAWSGRRRNLTVETKRKHVDANVALGGRCQCCGTSQVIDNGTKSTFAEFDHFYANSQPNVDHTWLICTPCHSHFSSGRVTRDRREAEFKAYQEKRRRLTPGQGDLF